MLKEYIAYFKDNPKGYWFKAKLFGWGWTPVKWQGWLASFVFIALVVWDFNRIDSTSHSSSDTLINFIPQLLILLVALILICIKKGEKTRWQWGPPKKK